MSRSMTEFLFLCEMGDDNIIELRLSVVVIN